MVDFSKKKIEPITKVVTKVTKVETAPEIKEEKQKETKTRKLKETEIDMVIITNLIFKMAKMKMNWNRCSDGSLALKELKKMSRGYYEEAVEKLAKKGIIV